jgi:hypothetical protein
MYIRTLPSRGMGDAGTNALLGGAISAGVSLATTGVSLWMNSIQLSHTADTATTQIVNGLEPLLNANKNAYLNGPGTCADQAAALAAFDTAFEWLRSPAGCGNGAYGSAGNRCISDRACESGCKFPWVAWYRDPIANDPRASGCAAQLAIDNPNAAEQAAIANLTSLTSGSTQQTNAGLFDTTGTAGGSPVAASISTIPSWVWLAAAALVVVMVIK